MQNMSVWNDTSRMLWLTAYNNEKNEYKSSFLKITKWLWLPQQQKTIKTQYHQLFMDNFSYTLVCKNCQDGSLSWDHTSDSVKDIFIPKEMKYWLTFFQSLNSCNPHKFGTHLHLFIFNENVFYVCQKIQPIWIVSKLLPSLSFLTYVFTFLIQKLSHSFKITFTFIN